MQNWARSLNQIIKNYRKKKRFDIVLYIRQWIFLTSDNYMESLYGIILTFYISKT